MEHNMSKKTISKYSTTSKLFHWIIALLVFIMLIVGFSFNNIPPETRGTAYMLHKSTGITILFLMILRLIWIHKSGKPPLPKKVPLWERVFSRMIQYGFYILLILMPLSGWIRSVAADKVPVYFGLFKANLPWVGVNQNLSESMANVHLIIAWIIVVFITLHVLGALKHHFIDKDDVLKKMWPGRNR